MSSTHKHREAAEIIKCHETARPAVPLHLRQDSSSPGVACKPSAKTSRAPRNQVLAVLLVAPLDCAFCHSLQVPFLVNRKVFEM